MDVTYKPPMDFEPECKMLEKNYVTCLNEKSVHDAGVPMACNVERVYFKQILWFIVDCPTRYDKFTRPDELKEVFLKFREGAYQGTDY